MNIKELQQKVCEFRDDRDWKQFHNPKDLAAAISIEAGELQEHFLWGTAPESFERGKTQDAIDEFADVMNYLLLYADALNIDIEKAVSEKIEKNAQKYPVEKAKGTSKKYTEL